MEPSRTILHINVTNFYAAVAQAVTPRLRTYPVAIATAGALRRMVIDTSMVAYQAGVRRGMLLHDAKRRCPDLVVLEPTPDLYDRAFAVILSEADRLSPRVEPAGPGHVFIDLTGTKRLLGDPLDNADRLRMRIKNRYRIDPAVAVASNKLISKVATRVIRPNGICQIVTGCEKEFLGPLPVRMLPDIDSEVLIQIEQFNINNIKELSLIPLRSLIQVLGRWAESIHKSANGIDNAPIRFRKEPAPTMRAMQVLDGQTNDNVLIEKVLFSLVSEAASQLRSVGMASRLLQLTITYSDAVRHTQCSRLAVPINGDLSLYREYKNLLFKAFVRRVRLSTMIVELGDISMPYSQLDLFCNGEEEEALMNTLDVLRGKFGKGIIAFNGQKY